MKTDNSIARRAFGPYSLEIVAGYELHPSSRAQRSTVSSVYRFTTTAKSVNSRPRAQPLSLYARGNAKIPDPTAAFVQLKIANISCFNRVEGGYVYREWLLYCT